MANQRGGKHSWMRYLVTLIVLGSALYVILSGRYSPKIEGWACVVVASILTYWMCAGKNKLQGFKVSFFTTDDKE